MIDSDEIKGEVQKWVRWHFSNLIILRDRWELLAELIKCTILQEEVSLRKIGPETAKILRNIHPNNARVSPSRRKTNRNTRNSNLPMDTIAPWLADEPGQSTSDAPLAHTCKRCAYYSYSYCTCIVVHTNNTPRCIRYSDKLPMKITCNCWNNSLWNHLSARPGKQMSLEFPGIISLQIQVTIKDFESWIHYWTIPLNKSILVHVPLYNFFHLCSNMNVNVNGLFFFSFFNLIVQRCWWRITNPMQTTQKISSEEGAHTGKLIWITPTA